MRKNKMVRVQAKDGAVLQRVRKRTYLVLSGETRGRYIDKADTRGELVERNLGS